MPRFRLVAMDLDGTLLDSRHSVPERNRLALEHAQRQGVKLALVTGRRLPAARPHVSQLSTDLLMNWLPAVSFPCELHEVPHGNRCIHDEELHFDGSRFGEDESLGRERRTH